MGTRKTKSCSACIAALTFASQVSAEPLQLEAHAGMAKAVGGYQGSETSIGFAGAAGVNLPIIPEFGLDGRVGAIFLSDGEPPPTATLQDGGSATAYFLRAGAQYRPWASDWGASALAGFWLSAGGGVTLTGGLLRPLAEGNIGYDLVLAEEGLGIGPILTLEHVFQPNSALRPEDANVLVLGLHLVINSTVPVVVDQDPDKDGVLDPLDRCPDKPEDRDGFDDSDGCPELDNDKDGIEDKKDRCPDNAEDKDGFEDQDGCPELDDDKDGVLDQKDRCLREPEDRDNFEDADGCPETDNDSDGFLDENDKCPNEPEVRNGYADDDGCPDSEQVRVVGDKIVLDEKVHFWVNSASIRKVSHNLLQRVAQLIRDNPDYIHIEVQGHSDQKGDANFNMKLSSERAESVMRFLIDAGQIEESRLSFQGFGEDQPLLPRDDEYALYMNRRVEFKITRRGAGASPALPADAPAAPPVTSPPPAPLPSPPDAAPAEAPLDVDADSPPSETDEVDPGDEAPAEPSGDAEETDE